MLRNSVRFGALFAIACSAACSGTDSYPETGNGGAANGGAAAMSGGASSGGALGNGGSPNGGVSGAAGSTSAGGNSGAGGMIGAGGITGAGGASSGGNIGAGGAGNGGKSAAGASSGGNIGAGGASSGGKSAGGSNSGGKSAGGASSGGVTGAGGASSGGKSAGGASSGGTSAGGTSSGGKSAGGTSSGGKSAGGTNAGGTSSGGSAMGGAGGSCPEVNAQLCGMTQQHNTARASVSPAPTTPLPSMTWDATLAAAAQDWADQCNFSHHTAGYGQNLYASAGGGPPTPQAVVNNWMSEAEDYDYGANSCSGVCGHYTQVVWRNSTLLGCGIKACSVNSPFMNFSNWYIVVCNYSPPGNNGSRPY